MGWPRKTTATQDGFTIVEMMIALSLMAMTMVAISGVFFSGLKAASAINTRTSAVALATRETEAIRAVPYESIGFYESQGTPPGPFPLFETLPTVTFGATGTNQLAPTGTATVGPVTYSIERHLLWVGANGLATAAHPATYYDEAYKKTVVIVSWTDGSGPHTLRQDSIIYPGGRGVYTAAGSTFPTTTTTAAPTAPGPATITSVAPAPAPLGISQLDITWTAPSTGGAVTEYIVQSSLDASFTTATVSSPPQSGTATTYQASGLASSTTYYFRVVAYSSPSLTSTSAVVSGTTLFDPSAPVCQVTSLALSGLGAPPLGLSTKTYLVYGNNKLDENLGLVLTYSGPCSGSFSVAGTTPLGAPAYLSPYALTGSGTTRTATILKSSAAWPAVGMHTFTVLKDGTAVSPAVQKTFLFCSATSTPSADANLC